MLNLLKGLLAVVALVHATPALAQDAWPSRALRIVVPFPPGGTTDIIARLVQQPLAERLQQSVVVENKAGAAGTAGTEAMVRAGDGHTIAIVISSLASNVALQPKLPFNVTSEIAPLTLVGFVPNLIAVHPSVAAQTLPELIALAKAKPGTLNYGTSGVGTANHFAGELFKLEAGVDLVHTPYRGGGPAINDLIGGQIPVGVNALSSVLPHVKAGKVRPLATTGAKRSTATPEVATVAELGLTGFEVVEWWGFVAPASMPAAHVQRLHREIVAVIDRPDIREKLVAQGVEVATNTPEAFKAFVGSEVTKLQSIVQRAGIKAE